jgi:alginate O-acetyltransferase complex protein AlgI
LLFNSYVFLFAFLPATLLGFWLASRHSGESLRPRLGLWWLNAASLFFYAWWAPRYTVLLLVSVLFNFGIGRFIARPPGGAVERPFPSRRAMLRLGVVGNLAALGYFKYANFFVDTVNQVSGAGVQLATIVLPLGISFFTFTQIAYLVDSYRRPHDSGGDFGDYLLFVLFFPHLLAGPIVHHGQLMPQMRTPAFQRLRAHNLVVGGAIFLVGMAKKVLGADTFVALVGPVFAAATAGQQVTVVEAWMGALAYTLQLYFDFSGYSDMAIGLARMFGIQFPRNFDSPYKATSIVDFWRRWHITLSSFLRDYLYIQLGGNRKGPARRYLNLFLTMLLGGLWHGAGWTFVIWGALHGCYLVVNHAFASLRGALGLEPRASTRAGKLAAGALTFLAVVVGWVYFRAPTVSGANRLLVAMAGGADVVLPPKRGGLLGRVGLEQVAAGWGVRFGELPLLAMPVDMAVLQMLVAFAVVWLLPNSGQMFERYLVEAPPGETADTTPNVRWYHWRPTLLWGVGLGVLLTLSLAAVAGKTEFIYFQF